MANEGYFKSHFSKKEQKFIVESKDKFGRVSIIRCDKQEKDALRKEFNKVQKELMACNVKSNTERNIPKQKRLRKQFINPCTPTNSEYVIKNFTCEKFVEGNSVEKLSVGKFFIVEKRAKEITNLKNNSEVCSHKYYTINEETYLLAVLPTLKFFNGKVHFNFPYIAGVETSYSEAIRLNKNISKYGFKKTVVNINDIPKVDLLKKVTFDTNSIAKRMNEKIKKNKKELAQIKKLKAIQLKDKSKKIKYTLKNNINSVQINRRRLEKAIEVMEKKAFGKFSRLTIEKPITLYLQ